VEAQNFDSVARRLARASWSRRLTVQNGGRALFALAAAAAALRHGAGAVTRAAPRRQSTPVATPSAGDPNAIEIDGAWFCDQVFALCTTAPCEISESDPTIANCHCVVVDGPAIGFKTCEERAQAGASLHSNFSTINVNSEFRVLTCPQSAPWANCLDVPCEIDSYNPAVATCQCQMVDSGPSLTFGGGCDTATCTSTIWSAAPEGLLGLAQFEAGMKMVDQPVTLPAACPSATPVASPAGTPAG
jgi:hypothetical protein